MQHALALSLVLVPLLRQGSPEIPPLSDAELQALATITEQKLLATVSFLAADELEGRDTPSPGLHIAGAYVAARFRGAGLEGLGAKQGYYLEAEVDTTTIPGSGIRLEAADGTPLPHYGLLRAGAERLDYEGKVLAAIPKEDEGVRREPQDPLGAPLLLDETAARGRRALFGVRRLVAWARKKGAIALLLRVDEQSPVLAYARGIQGRARLRRGRVPAYMRRENESFPVLLVPKESRYEGTIRLSLPPLTEGEAPVRNIAGVLRGRDPELAKEALVFSAHLDHIGRSFGEGDTILNGADDDASGVTCVLALADCFSALPRPPKRSLIFVCFWGEEKGLLGSRDFVSNPPWPLEAITADINLEMLGRPEEGARQRSWMTGWRHSDLGELMARGARREGVEIFRHRQYSARLYGASDNASFAAKGVIAHSFSAGSLHRDYHRPGDEWQKLDLPHMTKVCRGLAAGALPIAEGLLTPRKSAKK